MDAAIIGWAHQAQELLEPLGGRWLHTQAAADTARQIAPTLEPDYAIALIAAAYLHDIGYAPRWFAPASTPSTEPTTSTTSATPASPHSSPTTLAPATKPPSEDSTTSSPSTTTKPASSAPRSRTATSPAGRTGDP